ncbi:unnamed protein product [Urochloa humidicola]
MARREAGTRAWPKSGAGRPRSGPGRRQAWAAVPCSTAAVSPRWTRRSTPASDYRGGPARTGQVDAGCCGAEPGEPPLQASGYGSERIVVFIASPLPSIPLRCLQGSCWAFFAVRSVESINKLVTGELVTLSEQELVECSTNRGNSGCNCGLMDSAFEFIIKTGGIDTEDGYPYKPVDGKCDINRKNAKVVSIDGFEDVPKNDEKSLQKAVAHQPVSVAIEAGGREFQLYKSGYGTENDKDNWIVPNSWGPKWGESGYIRMEHNINATSGKCGIAMMASYPTKKGPNPPKPSPTPPTPPPPVAPEHVCDENYSCPAGSTCCCAFGFRSVCLVWGGCPIEGATCCKDHASCCPPNYPVCNIRAQTYSAK